MISVFFFGRMADVMLTRAISVPAEPARASLFALRDSLFDEAMTAGRVQPGAIRMSLNQVVVRDDVAIGDGDEIAFFSVFSGG